MRLLATHTTTYSYGEPVSLCHNEARLVPRRLAWQSLVRSQIAIDPEPDLRIRRKDCFGNDVEYFTISESHERLVVTARSVVEIEERPPLMAGLTPAWDDAVRTVRQAADPETSEAYQFVFDSTLVKGGAAFGEYARPSFPEGRPLLEACQDLNRRIFTEFHYDQKATKVDTSPEHALADRHGVCQDFAHVMIGCLRSLQIPARYISGYLRSQTPFSEDRLIGAEASHAWVSVFCPGLGWLDFDPTNNVMPNRNHLTVAWGRDYADVSPLKGVSLGGGDHTVDVAVRVVPDLAA